MAYGKIHIKTNHQPRPILVDGEGDSGFRYRGKFYNFNEFEHLPRIPGSLGWDGGCPESHLSAVVFKYVNEDEVIVGYARWGATSWEALENTFKMFGGKELVDFYPPL